MTRLPQDRTPTIGDWQRMSRSIREEIDSRIALLTKARTKLDECIGCGCEPRPLPAHQPRLGYILAIAFLYFARHERISVD
ncbi:MAG: MerR family DNA-binding protein [Sphingomonadaceae bacterium]